MGFKKTGTAISSLMVVGSLLWLLDMRSNRSLPPMVTQAEPNAEDLPNSQLSQPQNPSDLKRVEIRPSPYALLDYDTIRAGQENNEAWANKYEITDNWSIQFTSEEEMDKFLNSTEASYIEKVQGFSDIHVIQFPDSKAEEVAQQIQTLLSSNESVLWFEQEALQTFALRYDESPPAFNDPLLRDQWHLKNTGDRWNVANEDANVYPAWNYGVSGAGKHIAIIDTGTEFNHPDLLSNYRKDIDFDYLDNDASPQPESSDETHGTAVAGVAGAGVNGNCGVGVAYNSELIGIRLIHEDRGVSSSRQASAIAHRSDIIDIYNNSWGPDTDDGANMAGPSTLSLSAIQNAIHNGRNGLGSIYIWAAGNGRTIGSNVNYDGWASIRYSIAVGAVGDQGKISSYSEPGAPMLVCAPSSGNTSGIRTTDLRGQSGVDPGDCRIEFGGTSSASPLVAGVVALMLEANPNLGWRDVQHILAKTAVRVARSDTDWKQNGAGHWVNHNFGFGRVDAAAAVKVAQTWTNVPDSTEYDSGELTIEQSVPDNSSTGIELTQTVDSNIRVEHVSLTLDLDAAEADTMDWGNLHITLTSPSGTESILATPHTDARKSYSEWTYWTVRCLDESSAGEWTLNLSDRRSGNLHAAKSWQLKLYGTPIEEGDNQHPVANDDNVSIIEATTYIDVAANDTDADDDTLEVISIYKSPDSSITLLQSGVIEYTPGEGMGGTDTFGYTIHDSRGGIKTAQVNIVVPRPEANPDQVGTSQNSPITIDVLENDIDYDGDSMRVTEMTLPDHGGAILQPNNQIEYTPLTGFVGVDRFQYTITDDDDGTSSAEVTVYVTREDDFALDFDGDNDRVIIQNTQDKRLNTPFTIESWIRPEGWGEGETGYGRIFDTEQIVFYLHGTGFPSYTTNSLLISIDHLNGVRSIYNTPANSIKLNQWQHVAVTYDNISSVKLYINGIEQSTSLPFDNASGPVTTGSQLWMVGEAASTQRAFEGAIDEFRVWDVVRSSNDLRNNMDQPLNGNESGLLTYLPMNEGMGSQTNDQSSPTEDGTITEAKWIRGILGENTAPQANRDEVEVIASQKIIIPVTTNDSDPDGDELRVSRIINVSTGSASFLNGSIIFESPDDFTGVVRIDYEISDGYNGSSKSALVLVIGEGLYYKVWEAKNFDGSLGEPENDNDFDSLTNFAEYAYGTNPLSGFQDPTLHRLEYDGVTGITRFTYTLLRSSIDVSYKLMQSNDLQNWTVAIEDLDYTLISVKPIDDDSETRVIEFNSSDGQPIFVRLEATSLAGAQ